MANSSSNVVLFTLATAEQPLSIGDVAFRCGLSYNTVKKAVWADARITKHEGYPTLYSAEMPDQMRPDIMAIKYDKPDEGWMTWLDEIRPLLVSITAMSADMSKEEREKKAQMFKSLGRSFLSLGKDIEGLMDVEDWAHYLNWSDEHATP